jgi:four helix bundle protein
MIQDLIIYQKSYDLILWIFPIINKFPQKQRFVLGQQIENELLEIIKDIILANNEVDKSRILKRISIRLDVLRTLIRLAKDLKFLNIRRYENTAVKMNEIGRLLNGWMKRFV